MGKKSIPNRQSDVLGAPKHAGRKIQLFAPNNLHGRDDTIENKIEDSFFDKVYHSINLACFFKVAGIAIRYGFELKLLCFATKIVERLAHFSAVNLEQGFVLRHKITAPVSVFTNGFHDPPIAPSSTDSRLMISRVGITTTRAASLEILARF